jgi:uncharacterized radical SAM superfamily Fe-S cluster-containing enzyme
LRGEVFGRDEAVYLSRECPEHGRIEALVCSDINWFEQRVCMRVGVGRENGVNADLAGQTPADFLPSAA